MSDRKRARSTEWLVAGISFGIGLILLYLLRESLRQVIVLPIMYVGWLVGLVLGSLDQSFLWAILIILVSLVVTITIMSSLGNSQGSVSMESGERSRGRVAYWTRQISLARRTDYIRSDFQSSLIHLLYAVVASQYGLSVRDAEEKLKNGEIKLPISFEALLKDEPAFIQSPPESILEKIQTTFHARLKPLGIRRNHRRIETSSELDLDSHWLGLIDYIDEQLEEDDDGQNH